MKDFFPVSVLFLLLFFDLVALLGCNGSFCFLLFYISFLLFEPVTLIGCIGSFLVFCIQYTSVFFRAGEAWQLPRLQGPLLPSL